MGFLRFHEVCYVWDGLRATVKLYWDEILVSCSYTLILPCGINS